MVFLQIIGPILCFRSLFPEISRIVEILGHLVSAWADDPFVWTWKDWLRLLVQFRVLVINLASLAGGLCLAKILTSIVLGSFSGQIWSACLNDMLLWIQILEHWAGWLSNILDLGSMIDGIILDFLDNLGYFLFVLINQGCPCDAGLRWIISSILLFPTRKIWLRVTWFTWSLRSLARYLPLRVQDCLVPCRNFIGMLSTIFTLSLAWLNPSTWARTERSGHASSYFRLSRWTVSLLCISRIATRSPQLRRLSTRQN